MSTQSNSTKDKIDACAIALFVAKGTKGTSIRDIVADVGITEGAFYRHYKSKDSLIQSLFLQPYLALTEQIRTILNQGNNLLDSLFSLTKFMCERIDQEPVLFEYLLLTQHNILNCVPKDADTPFTVLQTFFKPFENDNRYKVTDSTFTTTIYLGMIIQSLISRKYKRSNKTMMEDYQNFKVTLQNLLIK